MATKQQVLNLAKKLNCEIDIEPGYIEVAAPAGKIIGDDVMHYSGYEIGLFAKSAIWKNLFYEMSLIRDCPGTDYCECGKQVAI